MSRSGKHGVRLAFYLTMSVLAGALLIICVADGMHLLAISALISFLGFGRVSYRLVRG